MKIYDKNWNFKDFSMKELVHGIHPYPAMLMPRIIRAILKENEDIKSFLDPYMGSGTSIVEAQMQCVDKIYGVDLNPLAVLIAKVKTDTYNIDLLKSEIQKCIDFDFLQIDFKMFTFNIIDTWFKKNTIEDLSKIKSYIDKEVSLENKNFFKVCFSETIRACSMTRNGEFKLYRIQKEKRNLHNPNVFDCFFNILKNNLFMIEEYSNFKKRSMIKLFNKSVLNISEQDIPDNSIELVVTSPPYGDSRTTVAYGQFSRLSNEWLNIENANKLDNLLMGGTKNTEDKNYVFDIKELDETINEIKEKEKHFKSKRYLEVIYFFVDYYNSIKTVSKKVKKGGVVVYVVGNRRVRNIEIPLDDITVRMFEKNGFKHKKTIIRDILNKRMPSLASNSNNKVGVIPTMSKEYIVIMCKVT